MGPVVTEDMVTKATAVKTVWTQLDGVVEEMEATEVQEEMEVMQQAEIMEVREDMFKSWSLNKTWTCLCSLKVLK